MAARGELCSTKDTGVFSGVVLHFGILYVLRAYFKFRVGRNMNGCM